MKRWWFLEKSHCEYPDADMEFDAEDRTRAIAEVVRVYGGEIAITKNNLVEIDKDGHIIEEEHE